MAVGALHHKNLGLSDADKARLTVDLKEGKAAVGVMAAYDTAPAISDHLTQLGGTSEPHELSDEAARSRGGDGQGGNLIQALSTRFQVGGRDAGGFRRGATAISVRTTSSTMAPAARACAVVHW